jgi:hypothetical protein
VGRRRLAGVDPPAYAGAVPHLRNATGHQVSRNARTALILASIAAAFFVGVIAKYWLLSA